ncbi:MULTISPECIES: anaerobic C4-dicarboxylate transporter [Pasteurellaceae]|uniref:C4-dicarboxylate transporter n=1 Tax=Pasteurella bettyae CCUG 2042 TaxID=1095749 RepID=I3DEM5_9PAST|nr:MULTISPECIES: anaerobic C4-dicarboxylate transporter [Pasteurellaceae]EIJ70168.1 transporter, anaerobic C4-dicarboxylate uptake (Dcu) family [Pasteurella bettyae CCUG 2042]SUB21971.1 anaerobic C4-dicarboxylate transporter DcuB-2 [Pasteurella bettyae]
MIWVEIFVVLGAIFMGLRSGGIGIGLWGGLGLAILTLGLGLPVGSIPVDVILIIMTVVLSAATLQACGGMDLIVQYAAKLMRKNPKYITFIAPAITWLMTIMAGTGFIVFSTLPVIAEISRESGVRPSKPLAASVVSSQMAVAGSPLSAAMAAMVSVMENNGVTFFQVMAVCIPVSFVASMVAAFISSLQGCELKDDKIYLERLQAGLVTKSETKKDTVFGSGSKLSVIIFLLATILIVLIAAVPGLKPVYENGKSLSSRDLIIIVMLASACLMLLFGKIKPDAITTSSIFRSGMTSVAVIIGIVTLGTTFVDYHLPEIKAAAGDVLTAYPLLLAPVLFLTCALLYSQGSTAPLIIPLAVALGVPNWTVLASFIAVTGIFILPTYPTSLAAMEIDTTGSTRAGKYLVDHPFFLPALIGVAAGVGFGFVIAPMIVA